MTALRSLLIADYDVILDNGDVQKGRFHTLSGLNKLFRSWGVTAQWPTYDLRQPRTSGEPDKLQSMLMSASAAFVPEASGVFDSDSLVETLNARLNDGLRVWVALPRITKGSTDSRTTRMTNFLQLHGMTPTEVGVFGVTREFDHPRNFFMRRKVYPYGFRDAQLFRGVDKMLFQQAHGILLNGDAFSTASIQPSDYNIVDMATDYFVDWNEPDMSLIATTFVGNNGGCIISSSGLVLGDPYKGPIGHSFPGVDENSLVVNNVVRFLLQSTIPREPATETVVHGLIQKIERNLLETVRLVLSASGAQWADGVSDSAKSKARHRSTLDGGKFSWEAYLDLADHLNTISSNMEAFSPLLLSLGFPTSRKKVEKELFNTGKLVELRILDAHATKRLIIDHAFSNDDLDFLQRIDQTVIRLWRAAKVSR